MAARKSHTAPAQSAADTQKRAEEATRMRVKCLEIASSVQTMSTSSRSLIASADKIFQYAKTGEIGE